MVNFTLTKEQMQEYAELFDLGRSEEETAEERIAEDGQYQQSA